jgi:AAA family ATP:ADP antiporter
MISLILTSGILSLFLFKWLNENVLQDKRYYDPSACKKKDNVQGKLSLKDSLRYLFNSSYLLCIAAVVICYNLVINLTEVLWKQQVTELYPNPADYTIYMNHIVSIIGLVATLASLFVSGNAIRKGGWTFTALLTPMILTITSIAFFGSFFLKQYVPDLIFSFIGMSPLAIVVFLGSAQNILSRGAKYSVFDSTKEMTFVPLSAENKLIGKAAIDGICSRFGKSSGSVVYQSLLLFLSTIPATAPYVALVLLGIVVSWVIAVRFLGKQFNELAQTEKSTDSITSTPSMAKSSEHVDVVPLDPPLIGIDAISPGRLPGNVLVERHGLLTEQQAI